MHQHPRQPLRPFSPSASPRLTSTANTSGDSMSVRTYSTEDLSAASQSVRSPNGKESTPKDRASLVVQHFFTKTALIICSSRVSLPPAVSKNGEAKMDRWVRISHLKSPPLYKHAHLLDHSSPLRRISELHWVLVVLCFGETVKCFTARSSCVSVAMWLMSCLALEH